MKKVLLILFSVFACLAASTARLSAQSFPQWDNSPNTNLLAGGGPDYLRFGVGHDQDVYYIGYGIVTIEPIQTMPGIWRWNKANGWHCLAGFSSFSDVAALTIQGHFLYVGGSFDSFVDKDATTNVFAHNIAKYDLNTGQWSAVGNDNLSIAITAITVDNSGSIYVGGQISLYTMDPNDPNYPFGDLIWDPIGILKWNGTGWANIGTGDEPAGLLPGDVFGVFENGIKGLATDGTNIFAIGGFNGVTNTPSWVPALPSHGVVKWDGTRWTQMGKNGPGIGVYTGIIGTTPITDEPITDPYSLAIAGTNLFVVGPFSYPHPCIARFSTITGDRLPCDDLKLNGSTPFEGTNNNTTSANLLGLVAHDGRIYLAGNFDHVGTVAANGAASWADNGTPYGVWSNLGSGLTADGTNYGSPQFLASSSTAVYFGCYRFGFNSAGGLAVPYEPSIARWLTAPDVDGSGCTTAPSGLVS